MNCATLKDEQLISNIRDENCSDSIIELSNRHQGLIVKIIRRYSNIPNCSGVSMQDFLDDTNYIVFSAARDFDEEKHIKFTTWLGNKVRYHCLNALNKQAKYYSSENEEFTESLAEKIVNEECLQKIKIDEQLEYIKNILSQFKDQRIQKIINMRYFNGSSKKGNFQSIAKKLGMSIQGVVDLHDNFINFISEKIRAEQKMDEI